MQLNKIDDCRWEVPKTGAMRVPGIIYTVSSMVDHIIREKAAQQVANVATMPGIVEKSMAMPDIHWGYGFPIGGVAAFDVKEGVISPGGIGYDINCGVRLLRTNLEKEDVLKEIPRLISGLFSNIPSGVGSTGKLNLKINEVKQVLEEGSAWAVKRGYGTKDDLKHTEESGTFEGADPSCASERSLERGREQLGTLGAGNHFLEIQAVEEVYDEEAANILGLFKDQITVMIHTGSRGLGYQICDDYLRILHNAMHKYNISIPDPQLVCAPINSGEAQRYFAAMAGAANYAWANRQIITHWVRETLMQTLGSSPKDLGLEVVYDVAHNIGKFEEHKGKKLFVHRKGATRAFAKGHPDIPDGYKQIGQPVLVPGTMGTESYVLTGTQQAMDETWGSTCHGAGRVMSRTQALKGTRGSELAGRLEKQGIHVKSESWKTLAEEAPSAYKDVSKIVEICHMAGISKKVAKLKPLGVIKG
ncbi:MAG: RtcB family protein [Elusimicrobia bacterium]|nr:RtcB family protein [Candidatus Liberimonas magnetica]